MAEAAGAASLTIRYSRATKAPLLPVLLDPRGTQAGKAVAID